jgi:hypothetical protein
MNDECSICKHAIYYSDEWDAKYCANCNEWKEPRCCETDINKDGKIECFFECWKRPDKPIKGL